MDEKITLLTQDPFGELEKTAQSKGVVTSSLDFIILGLFTNYSVDGNESAKLGEKELEIFNDDKFFLNPSLEITQEYKIQIYKKMPSSIQNAKACELIIDENCTQILAQIKLKELVVDDYLAMDLLQIIYKKMLKKSFKIGIRIFDFKTKLLELIQNLKAGKLEGESAQVLVARGVLPADAQNERLVLNYKENMAQKTGTPINQISIVGVGENELVLTFVKEKLAQNGRGLNLKEIINDTKIENKKIEFSCSENLEPKESEEKTEYYAKKKGFVADENRRFDIQNSLNFTSLNFKTHGYIYAGLDKEVSIVVANTSSMEEAINSGVLIECQDLSVNGSVAQNTTIRVSNLKLMGSTHSKSKIYAKNAYINTHRGYLEAEEADIDALENGEVKAQLVKVKKSLGGNIRANKITIDTLSSNNTLFFTQSVILGSCAGNNNKFIAQATHDESSAKAQFDKLEERQKALPAIMNSLNQVIHSSKEGVGILMHKITQLQAQNQPIPPNYTQMVQKFKDYEQQLVALEGENKDLEDKKNELIKELENVQNELLKAKVINKEGTWSDLNELKFRLYYPQDELIYSTQKDEKVKCFHLEKSGDGKISIQKSNEIDDKDLE